MTTSDWVEPSSFLISGIIFTIPLPIEKVALIFESIKDMGILIGKGGLFGNVNIHFFCKSGVFDHVCRHFVLIGEHKENSQTKVQRLNLKCVQIFQEFSLSEPVPEDVCAINNIVKKSYLEKRALHWKPASYELINNSKLLEQYNRKSHFFHFLVLFIDLFLKFKIALLKYSLLAFFSFEKKSKPIDLNETYIDCLLGLQWEKLSNF
jgi:hypothetical protein